MRIPRDPKCLPGKIHDGQILPNDPPVYKHIHIYVPIYCVAVAEVCGASAGKIQSRTTVLSRVDFAN